VEINEINYQEQEVSKPFRQATITANILQLSEPDDRYKVQITN